MSLSLTAFAIGHYRSAICDHEPLILSWAVAMPHFGITEIPYLSEGHAIVQFAVCMRCFCAYSDRIYSQEGLRQFPHLLERLKHYKERVITQTTTV